MRTARALQSFPLVPLSGTSLQTLTSVRPGETKLGEALRVLSDPVNGHCDIKQFQEDLQSARASSCRFAILGVPEDIGPRANLGRGGANSGWDAFLPWFVNMQHVSSQFQGDSALLLGHVDVIDLQKEADELKEDSNKATNIRNIVQEIDSRVEVVAKEVLDAGLELVVIGGGHNNCLPIIRAGSKSCSTPLSVCNLDPHGDIRSTQEGRHSGNGFSTALEEGCLGTYYLSGYHRRANSEAAQLLMATNPNIKGSCFDDWLDDDSFGLSQSISEAIAFFDAQGGTESNRGIELDLDAIAFMPTSAASPSGVTVEDARRFVRRLAAKQLNVKYLHLAEGAPSIGGVDGNRIVGKTLAYLTCDFMECRSRHHQLA